MTSQSSGLTSSWICFTLLYLPQPSSTPLALSLSLLIQQPARQASNQWLPSRDSIGDSFHHSLSLSPFYPISIDLPTFTAGLHMNRSEADQVKTIISLTLPPSLDLTLTLVNQPSNWSAGWLIWGLVGDGDRRVVLQFFPLCSSFSLILSSIQCNRLTKIPAELRINTKRAARGTFWGFCSVCFGSIKLWQMKRLAG